METSPSRPAGAVSRGADAAPVRRRLTISVTPRSIWLAAAIGVAVLLGVVLVSKALSALVLLFIAITLGEAIRPLVARLERYRIPQPLAVLLIDVAVFVVLGGLLWLLLAPLVGQVGAFSASVPDYVAQLQRWADQVSRSLHANQQLGPLIDGITKQLVSALQGAAPGLIGLPFNVLSGLFGLIISLLVVLTMTLFWLQTSAKLRPFVVGLFPARRREQAGDVLTELGRSLGGYVRGTLVDMVLIGLLTGIGLFVLGMPYALLLGVLAGLTELLPFVGPWISGSVAVLVALVTVDPLKALEVFFFFNVVQQVEGNTVQPLVMSRAVHVDPLEVIVAVFIGGQMLGLVGAVLAVPLAAVVHVLAVRVLAPAIRQAAAAEDEEPAA